MTQGSDRVRQEAAAMVIDECRQWLTQIVKEEMEKIIENTKYIADSKQRVEQITAAFKGETGGKIGKDVIEDTESQTEKKVEEEAVAVIRG